MPTKKDSEPIDDEWDVETDDPDTNDWTLLELPAGESHCAAFRRAIEIAKEERALRAALDDFFEHG